jgi:hypothetical protein
MMNIGIGSIITKGLGGPACNLLIFGPFHLYIEPLGVTPTPTATSVTPTPTPTSGLTPTVTPTITPSPSVTPSPSPSPGIGGGGGGGASYPSGWDDDLPEEQKYKLTFVVKFRKKRVTRTFIVDSFKKDQIIKRVGQINTLRIKFKTAWNKVKNNRFTAKWKK